MAEKPSEDHRCHPAKWADVLIFFLANILAHAATVLPSLGNTIMDNIEMALLSLFIPYFGVVRAASRISRGVIFAGSPLQKASRAGALCIVGRTEKWPELKGGKVEPCTCVEQGLSEVFSRRGKDIYSQMICAKYGVKFLHGCNPENVHGQRYLTEGYAIYPLDGFEVEEFKIKSDLDPTGSSEIETLLPCNYSVVKPLASIFQVVYASIELYKHQKHQTDLYGYGAYPLIVVPYILMSLMNLMAAISCPEYPSFFLVESDIMDEATTRGCKFVGAVGRAKSAEARPELKRSPFWEIFISLGLARLLESGVSRDTGVHVKTCPTMECLSNTIAKREEEGEEHQKLIYPEYGEATEWEQFREVITGHLSPHLSWIERVVFTIQGPERMHGILSEGIPLAVAGLLICIVVAGPFAIAGALTGFKVEGSAFSQRVWLVIWVPFNLIAMGVGHADAFSSRGYFSGVLRKNRKTRDQITKGIISKIIFATWVIGLCAGVGLTTLVFVVAGKSMMHDEVCKD